MVLGVSTFFISAAARPFVACVAGGVVGFVSWLEAFRGQGVSVKCCVDGFLAFTGSGLWGVDCIPTDVHVCALANRHVA